MRFLCEIKRASPSAGEIRPGADAPRIAEIYREAGASGISLVTEEQFFRGRPEDLPAVRAAGLPVLMKDFLVDPWQVGQARSLGADAVLLIVAMNDRPLLEELRAAARELELEVLVEVHDAAEIEVAWRLAPELCGVNHRNLNTLEIDLELGVRLLPGLPPAAVHLAEKLREARLRPIEMLVPRGDDPADELDGGKPLDLGHSGTIIGQTQINCFREVDCL